MSFMWGLRGMRGLLIKSKMYGPALSQIKHIKFEQIKPPKLPCNIDEKNECLKRPISPHVTIYKFEVHMLGSLFHRTTGIILCCYFITFGIGTLLLPHDLSYYVNWIEDCDLPQGLITATKFIIALPFTFHFMGGIRHLIWDLGVMLNTMGAVQALDYASFALGIGTAVGLALI